MNKNRNTNRMAWGFLVIWATAIFAFGILLGTFLLNKNHNLPVFKTQNNLSFEKRNADKIVLADNTYNDDQPDEQTKNSNIFLPLVIDAQTATQTPTQDSGEGLPKIVSFGVNVTLFGAFPDDDKDDSDAIQFAIDSLSETGGILLFPRGVFLLSKTMVIGNKTEKSWSTVDGITIMGEGTGATGYYTYDGLTGKGTIFKWVGEHGGTVININGAEGVTLRDFSIDGNALASTLIDADFAFGLFVSHVSGYQWTDGYAIKIWNQRDTAGGHAQVDQHWEYITMTNPHGDFAGGMDIAPTGSYNVNELTVVQATLMRSDSEEKVASVRLGYVDHIRFLGGLLGSSKPSSSWKPGHINKIAIEVKPIADFENNINLFQFPCNVTFVAVPFYGGIWHNDEIRARVWDWEMKPALIFYPYYTADEQTIPPVDYTGNQYLPFDLVGGFTDAGESLNP